MSNPGGDVSSPRYPPSSSRSHPRRSSSPSPSLSSTSTDNVPLLSRNMESPGDPRYSPVDDKAHMNSSDHVAHERSTSVTDITNDSSLTLYDKKALLINREFDAMGMGRYQWCIWSLCGFGYLIDLLWAQAFGLVLSPLQQEFGFLPAQSGNISVAFSAGLTAGAAFWGILVDIIGRQWAFNLTVLISSVFGMALGGANDYNTFLVLTAFVGLGVGGNIPIDTTITLEAIGQRHRRVLPFLSIFQPVGVVITTAIAYGFIPKYGCKPDFTMSDALPSCNEPSVAPGQPCCGKDNNMGWRYTLFTIGGITLAVFFLRFVIFRFQESPKFLLYRGRDEKAIKVMEYISKFNKRECTLTLQMFEELTSEHDSMGSGAAILGGGGKQLKATWGEKIRLELDRYKLFFANRAIAIVTVLLWLTYICDYWGFTVAGTYLPTIIAQKNGALNTSLEYTYRSYVYIYLPGVVGVLLGVLGYDLPRIGRKVTMIFSAGLMGASLFIFSAINSNAGNIGINAMEYFFQSMFNAVLYGVTPEFFAAPIRGTASGICSFWGRLFGIVSPLIAAHLLPTSPNADPSEYNKVLYLAGGVTLGCVVWLALLPNKMVGAESM